MSETITLNLAATVASGPTLEEDVTLELSAYDKLAVDVPQGKSDFAVELQPGEASSVRLLLIKSSHYGAGLAYSVQADAAPAAGDGGGGGDGGGAAAAAPATHVLDQPHLLIGIGAIGLLGAKPARLVFANDLGPGKDARIQILVGRDATPSAEG